MQKPKEVFDMTMMCLRTCCDSIKMQSVSAFSAYNITDPAVMLVSSMKISDGKNL